MQGFYVGRWQIYFLRLWFTGLLVGQYGLLQGLPRLGRAALQLGHFGASASGCCKNNRIAIATTPIPVHVINNVGMSIIEMFIFYLF